MKEKTEILFDEVDLKILNLLTRNSRMQWQEIGEEVHLTGQAVRNRINKLEKAGILKGYTITIDYKKLNGEMSLFIAVFMKTINHADFISLVNDEHAIVEAHRTGGEACYLLKVCVHGEEELTNLLDKILAYGNYKVSLSLQQVK
jgi:Lrp/AsnC family leucine-responsive transcriptional regulator